MRWVAPSWRAYHSASPSTSRPSASVFRISTVFPSALVTTSPGLIARPPGMFSVIGTTPRQRTGRLSRAMAAIAAITAAPPDMSSFILSMLSAGLIEMPPVSNVIPLPTRPSVTLDTAPAGSCRSTSTRGGSWLPWAMLSSRPILSSAMRVSSSTSTPSPAAAASAAPRSANTRGVRRLPGSLASSRAWFVASPRMTPRATAASNAAPPSRPAIATSSSQPGAWSAVLSDAPS